MIYPRLFSILLLLPFIPASTANRTHDRAYGKVALVYPAENALLDSDDVTVEATASDFPQDWSVGFVVDGAYGHPVPGTFDQASSFWRASLGHLNRQTHTVAAVMTDENGIQHRELEDVVTFDVGDLYVVFGDSVSEGIGDDLARDNWSADGRNKHTGYAPILNDLLTRAKGYPHSVVLNQLPGYTAGDALSEIEPAIAAHPESRYFLLQFGTNDSNPDESVPSGLTLSESDRGYPGSFKYDMQQLIDAVVAAGKIPLLAKVPMRYGNCSSSAGCPSYVQSGISPQSTGANKLVREYNSVIDELIVSNELFLDPSAVYPVPFVAPDLYRLFENTGLDGQGKSPLFFDWLHPNGRGYAEIAQQWLESLTATVGPPDSSFSGHAATE